MLFISRQAPISFITVVWKYLNSEIFSNFSFPAVIGRTFDFSDVFIRVYTECGATSVYGINQLINCWTVRRILPLSRFIFFAEKYIKFDGDVTKLYGYSRIPAPFPTLWHWAENVLWQKICQVPIFHIQK
jgi:hypothetical protein